MAVRWCSVVVDCPDVAAQAAWWAAALGWTTSFESEDEVVLVPQHAGSDLVQSTPWQQVPPGLVFVPVPEGKTVENRLHLDLAAHTSDDRDVEIARLVELRATPSTSGRGLRAGGGADQGGERA